MTDFRDSFEQQLVEAMQRLDAAEAQQARRRSPWRRRAPTALLALLAIGGTAAAATSTWQPVFGDPSHPEDQPSVSTAAPPQAQLTALRVLRRPADEADRDVATQDTLRFLSRYSRGIHADYIRRLHTTGAAGAVTLVPSESWQPGAGEAVIDDPLCVIFSDIPDTGAAKSCWNLAAVRRGEATGQLGQEFYGLVADGVSSVTATFADGAISTGEVHDNFFVLQTSSDRHDPEGNVAGSRMRTLTFRDAAGDALLVVHY